MHAHLILLTRLGVLLVLVAVGAASCRSKPAPLEPVTLSYVGSSTVAFFVRAAGAELPDIEFSIDTEPESDGGERAILSRSADLAGLAREPGPTVLSSGVAAAMIGRDALAVIVHEGLSVEGLTREQLGRIFAGRATNWSAFGGPELEITTFLVGPDSATRAVFREQVMQGLDFEVDEVVTPDADVLGRVASTPGGIGFLSFAFLGPAPRSVGVRALAVDGQAPSLYDFEYPIARPLYLLWRPGTPGADRFVQWATSAAGQQVVLRYFPGIDVIGSVDAQEPSSELGTLVVYTATFWVTDGDIEYYPHRPYEVLTEQGELVQRVRNHRGVNDEDPMHVTLAPGVYLIRTQSARGKSLDFYATLRSGRMTVLRVDGRETESLR